MKRFAAFLAVLVLMVSVLAGCSGPQDSDTIRIGFIGPLTGDSQPWGEAQLNEIKLCVEDLNKNGGILGRQVELFYYDNRADNIESANATKRLIQENKVCAVLGPNASGAAIAMSSVCDENQVPMIATNATNPQVTVDDKGNVRPYVFRVCLIDDQYGAIVANYAYTEMGLRNVAILYEVGSDYSMGLKNAFESAFKALGGTITTVEGYKTDDVDFRAQLSTIKDTNSDAIFLPALYKQIALATNQARELGVTTTFLGTDSWFNGDVLELSAASVEGSVFTAAMDTENEALEGIKEEYRTAYGEEIDAMGTTGYYGYDAFQVLMAAIEKAGSDDPKAIRDALEGLSGVQGCVGEVSLNAETHNTIRTVAIMTVENGAFKTLELYAPEI
ncbi:MAG: ABC transporter substrate-binding protein [Oscillospiraceae bacterium]|nr:ABC transporter substrate-binding protein [Oscillospiraceae bacterium]